MLTVPGAERDTAVTPSRECEGVTAECQVLLCYQPIALCNC
jgi:hypothetical protein